MKRRLLPCLAALAWSGTAAGQGLQQVRLAVPAGGERVIMTFGTTQPGTCRAEVPAVRILEAPRRGRLRVETRVLPVTKPGHACRGRPLEQAVLLYTGRAGGEPDRFLVSREGTPGSPGARTLEVTVRSLGAAPPAPRPAPLPAAGRFGEGHFPGGIAPSARSGEMLRDAIAPRPGRRVPAPPAVPMYESVRVRR